MQDFFPILIQNYGVNIICCVFLAFFIVLGKSLSKDISIRFIVADLFAFLLAIADAFEEYLGTFPRPSSARIFAASSAYSIRVLILLAVFMIFARNQSKKIKISFSIPAVINTLASFSAFFTNKAFYFTENNVKVRGPIIVIPFVVSILYFILLIAEAAKDTHKGDSKEKIFIFAIFAFAMTGTILEVSYGIHGILSGVSIIGLTFYYIHFLSKTFNYDLLTDACIETRLYQDIVGLTENYGVVEIDINNLKHINETQGRAAGDKAIVAVAHAIRDALTGRARVYRTGADEFVVISKLKTQEQLNNTVEKIKLSIRNTHYSAAVGSSMCQGEKDSFENVLQRADEEMLKNKSISKGMKL